MEQKEGKQQKEFDKYEDNQEDQQQYSGQRRGNTRGYQPRYRQQNYAPRRRSYRQYNNYQDYYEEEDLGQDYYSPPPRRRRQMQGRYQNYQQEQQYYNYEEYPQEKYSQEEYLQEEYPYEEQQYEEYPQERGRGYQKRRVERGYRRSQRQPRYRGQGYYRQQDFEDQEEEQYYEEEQPKKQIVEKKQPEKQPEKQQTEVQQVKEAQEKPKEQEKQQVENVAAQPEQQKVVYKQHKENSGQGVSNKSIYFPQHYLNYDLTNVPTTRDLQNLGIHQLHVLMIAEKPSVAKSITDALCLTQYKHYKIGGMPVYEYEGQIFNGVPALFKVTSCVGHLYGLDFPQEYQNWKSTDSRSLFEAPLKRTSAAGGDKVLNALQQQAPWAGVLVLWLDNDREGENICFELVNLLTNQMQKYRFKQVYRAQFNSLTEQDLREGFQGIKDGPDWYQSTAVTARQEIDLRVGVAFTRCQTLFCQQRYSELADKLISFGPCQTPTLGLVVQRAKERKTWKQQILGYHVQISGDINGRKWIAELATGIVAEGKAHEIKKNLESHRDAVICKINKEDAWRGRPVGLNTTSFLKVASEKMGIGPHQAMVIVERLYLAGFITYPRTESTFYPKKFDFGRVINALKYYQNNKISEYANKLQNIGLQKPKQGVDCGDHPPITPTEKTFKPTSKSSNDEVKLYEYISQHFLATISEDQKFLKAQLVLEFGNYRFNLNGTQAISDGFIEVMPWLKIPDQYFPNVKPNEKIPVLHVESIEQYTKQPEYMSESELIGKMEQFGIGTDASMPMHINNICEREYVIVVQQKRQLIPTDLGFNLIASYEVIDKELVEPQMRSSIENQVNLIAKQKMDYLTVTKQVLDVFLQKFDYFTSNISKLDQLFLKTFETVENQIEKAQTLSKCGKCSRYMKFLPKKLQLICEKCQDEYELPQDGKVKIHGEKYCEICKFQILVFTQNGTQLSYYVCPHCYNNKPQLEDIKNINKLKCLNCPMKTCNFSYMNNMITKCDDCPNGQLILDPIPSSGKHYMTCNNCNAHRILIEKAKDVKRQQTKCENCGSQLLKISYQKVQQKLGQKDSTVQPDEFNGCLFCNKQLCEKYKQINEIYKKEQQQFYQQQKPKHYGKGKQYKKY